MTGLASEMIDYYRVLDDNTRCADRWFLSEPLDADGVEIDARQFRYGCPFEGARPISIPIQYPGRRVAFNLAAFDMPVVTSEIAGVFEGLGFYDLQRFPVTIGGESGFEIINVTVQLKCVDEVRSHVRKWGLSDNRPDKIGQYREFNPLVIDPALTEGRHFFRIWGSLVELIVSERLKDALAPLRDLGVVFQRVTGHDLRPL